MRAENGKLHSHLEWPKEWNELPPSSYDKLLDQLATFTMISRFILLDVYQHIAVFPEQSRLD